MLENFLVVALPEFTTIKNIVDAKSRSESAQAKATRLLDLVKIFQIPFFDDFLERFPQIRGSVARTSLALRADIQSFGTAAHIGLQNSVSEMA